MVVIRELCRHLLDAVTFLLLLGHTARMQCIDAAPFRMLHVAWSVCCLCVGTWMNSAKVAEPIEMLFGARRASVPWKRALLGEHMLVCSKV